MFSPNHGIRDKAIRLARPCGPRPQPARIGRSSRRSLPVLSIGRTSSPGPAPRLLSADVTPLSPLAFRWRLTPSLVPLSHPVHSLLRDVAIGARLPVPAVLRPGCPRYPKLLARPRFVGDLLGAKRYPAGHYPRHPQTPDISGPVGRSKHSAIVELPRLSVSDTLRKVEPMLINAAA